MDGCIYLQSIPSSSSSACWVAWVTNCGLVIVCVYLQLFCIHCVCCVFVDNHFTSWLPFLRPRNNIYEYYFCVSTPWSSCVINGLQSWWQDNIGTSGLASLCRRTLMTNTWMTMTSSPSWSPIDGHVLGGVYAFDCYVEPWCCNMPEDDILIWNI